MLEVCLELITHNFRFSIDSSARVTWSYLVRVKVICLHGAPLDAMGHSMRPGRIIQNILWYCEHQNLCWYTSSRMIYINKEFWEFKVIISVINICVLYISHEKGSNKTLHFQPTCCRQLVLGGWCKSRAQEDKMGYLSHLGSGIKTPTVPNRVGHYHFDWPSVGSCYGQWGPGTLTTQFATFMKMAFSLIWT